ncbi:hypothetical protein M0M57_04190 [Flavobacterium azooxidireducens]|uniref:YD repeat-containing protein n=1 Tax=Flavobacterium azooxidireducens TaxID=1871076 RepID=A0ABY4KI45_9FLAO|nr:hypothetical protein [Flavobacterium azooxidireducens]UPQ80040.1 hypothetical protein M0M57_04190 [Flavobacterium azooxidireducens]
MKKLIVFVFASFLISCSSDDGFENANGSVDKKYVTKTTTTGNGDSNVSTVTYDTNKKVLTASDGEQIKYFTYRSDGSLEKISGGGDNLFTSEVISTIYDAYEIGDILQYDSNGNPTVLELYEDDYWSGERYVYTATISYDDKPFTFYHTLDAAGIIDVLNSTQLNFGMAPSSPEIIMAKLLLPVNNPYRAIIKDEDNVEIGRVEVSYNYGTDKYPISSTVVINDDGYVDQYSVLYEYLP